MAVRKKKPSEQCVSPARFGVADGIAMGDRSGADPLRIVRGSKEDIPSLEPLWVAVHHVHQASMPELAPYVSDEETWRERQALYEEVFRKPETFLFLARVEHELVGYALGHVLGSAESWWSDTWDR